ncbi:Transcriptional regulatory protein, C terminal [Lentzea fradiae]|uniref:Transcriptional regulatory protein, C terminal n=1 Tax=Lentzea fradiae TaxID=200378 RepID=A0A1G7L7U8_9PSEU|nr:AAA family ATPase [Lentzea fradiae]SDF45446.1 Transcriptional regulatory protein, C terminal [Lentzea fradiae]
MRPRHVSLASPIPRSRLSGTLPRREALRTLRSAETARLRLVTGPAGAGKSVLVRHLLADAERPRVAVDCPATEPGELARVLGRLAGTEAAGADALLRALERFEEPLTVVFDGVHALTHTADRDLVDRLVTEAPEDVRFVVTARHVRDLRLTDVPGPVHRTGFDDLRFGADEVVRLFESAGVRVPADPESLCHRVDGLAAALVFLRMDISLLGADQAEAVFADPVGGSERLREFLTREVVDPLPAGLRDLLVDVSPLGVLEGPMCDVLLGRDDSAELLAELAAREPMVFRLGDGAYRLHTSLRELLERRLAERYGTRLTSQAYLTAAVVLSEAGRWDDAHRCSARAGDWVTAARIAHEYGVPAPRHGDPWGTLAEARRLRAAGRFAQAHELYTEAASRLPDGALRRECDEERAYLSHWLGDIPVTAPASPVATDVLASLVLALRTRPSTLVGRTVPTATPVWTLARAVAAMVDGRTEMAVELARPLAGARDPFTSLGARILVTTIETALHGKGTVAQFHALAAEAEAEGWLWLARFARAATAVLDAAACADARAVLAECEEAGDTWSWAFAVWLLLIGEIRANLPHDRGIVRTALVRLRRMDAPLLEMWLRALVGDLVELIEADEPDLRRNAPGWAWDQAMARHNCRSIVERLRTPHSPAHLRPVPAAAPVADRPVAIRCFGGFELTARGVPVDLGGLRAQARRVLRVLAAHAGQPLHEERLVAVLWPDTPLKSAKRRLQVAISSLRTHLKDRVPDAEIARQGCSYLLRLPREAVVDVVEFGDAMRRWRSRPPHTDLARARQIAETLLDLHRGEYLAEEGNAEWVLARRETLRGETAGVAAALARLELDRGNAAAAIDLCERALAVDQLDHRLWSLLSESRRRAGHPDGALRAWRAYQDLVAEC